MEKLNFYDVFKKEKPIIGMIHLAGKNQEEKIKRALDELRIYQEAGVEGAIIEDYCGYPQDIWRTFKETQKEKFEIILGINILRDPYSAFNSKYFGAKFIQFDSVQTRDLDLELYENLKKKNKEMIVLGGVGFKYVPFTGNPLEQDLKEARTKCEAIVTTGKATGIETPLEKLKEYKEILNEFPLIVGAGVNITNVLEQLRVTDGAIIGSYFKPNSNVNLPVDKYKVKDLMDIVKEIRK